jgi:tetratricopeptide (TPR) repeat protein
VWLLLALLALGACRKPSFEQNYRNGVENLKNGNYDDARTLLARAYLQNPDSLEARYQLALSEIHLHQIRGAYELLLAAEARDHFQSSVSLPIRLELAKIFIGAKDYDSAQARLLRVLEKDPHNREARSVLATTLALQSQPEAARQQVDLLLAEDPSNQMGRDLDATLDLLSQKAPQAEASLLEEVKITGRSVESLVALANFYWVTRQRQKAVDVLLEVAQREPGNVARRMQLGSLYAKMGNQAGAEKMFREAGQIAPGDRTAVMALASYYVRIADWTKAAAELESLVKKNPDEPTRSLLASVYYRAGRRAEAKKLAEQMIGESSSEPGPYLVSGLLHLDAREYDAALLQFDRVLREQHDSETAEYLLALASYGSGRDQVAVEHMERALKLNGKLLPARLWLVDYNLKRGSNLAALNTARGAPPEQAGAPEIVILSALCDPTARLTLEQQASLQRALLAKPQFILTYENLGMTTLLRQYGGGLRDELEAMVKKAPQFRSAQTILVKVLEEQGQMDQATIQAQKQVAANPQSADALLTLARLQLRRGQRKEVRETLEKAAALQPENPEVMVQRAEFAADIGDFNEAASQLDAFTERYPKSSQGWTFKGILYQQNGKLERATAFYERALQEDRNNPIAANNLSLMLATNFHDPHSALELAQRAHQIDPAKPEITDTLGWVQYLCGNLPDSLKTLAEAVRMQPKNASFRYHLGVVQSRSSRPKEALANLETALSLDPHLPEAAEIKSILAALSH